MFGKKAQHSTIDQMISELTTRRIMMVRQKQEQTVEISQAKKAKDRGRERIAKTLVQEIKAQLQALDDILLHFLQLRLMGRFQDQVLGAYSRVEASMARGTQEGGGDMFEAMNEGFEKITGRLEAMRDRQDDALRGIRADHMATEARKQGQYLPSDDSDLEAAETSEEIESRLKKRDLEFN